MAKFMLKCILLVSVLFLGVLLGMQQASQAMNKMKGYSGTENQNALTVSRTAKGEKRAVILGGQISSHDIREKKQKLEKMKTYNFFSQGGKTISKNISDGFSKVIHKIAD
ncbi:DUF3679 domain-containing protein [Peribacillus kribbensis]|uniref:DUF3679 domain-containing protein n=1 Tax=Peribacillus kribbensis TaxID=356658 RepID=UPI0003F86775|nr:DUF3679 domain-containing protein [Peribacillus kribbensis]